MNKIKFDYKSFPVIKPVRIDTKSGNLFQRLNGWRQIRKWKLVNPFYFSINGIPYFIPHGFVFDGASVPRFFWFFLYPTGILMIPGLIHDFGYANQYLPSMKYDTNKQLKFIKLYESFGRKEWDWLFYLISVEVNGFIIINYIAYFGVRIGGWLKYKRKKNDSRG